MSKALLVVVICTILSLVASPQTTHSKLSSVRHKDPSLQPSRQHSNSSVVTPHPSRVSVPSALGKSGDIAKTSSVGQQLASLEKQTVKAQAPSRAQRGSRKLDRAVGQKQAKGDRNLPINFKGSTPGKTAKLQSSGAKQGRSPRLGRRAATSR